MRYGRSRGGRRPLLRAQGGQVSVQMNVPPKKTAGVAGQFGEAELTAISGKARSPNGSIWGDLRFQSNCSGGTLGGLFSGTKVLIGLLCAKGTLSA